MAEVRDQDGAAHALGGRRQRPVRGAEALAQWAERGGQRVLRAAGCVELHPHEEQAGAARR